MTYRTEVAPIPLRNASEACDARVAAILPGITGPLPSPTLAEHIAHDVFAALDPRYARHLSPMRVDTQTRTWRTVDGTDVEIVVQWAKHMHPNGTYNWVTSVPGAQSSRWNANHTGTTQPDGAPPNSGITTGGSPHERAPDPSCCAERAHVSPHSSSDTTEATTSRMSWVCEYTARCR